MGFWDNAFRRRTKKDKKQEDDFTSSSFEISKYEEPSSSFEISKYEEPSKFEEDKFSSQPKDDFDNIKTEPKKKEYIDLDDIYSRVWREEFEKRDKDIFGEETEEEKRDRLLSEVEDSSFSGYPQVLEHTYKGKTVYVIFTRKEYKRMYGFQMRQGELASETMVFRGDFHGHMDTVEKREKETQVMHNWDSICVYT